MQSLQHYVRQLNAQCQQRVNKAVELQSRLSAWNHEEKNQHPKKRVMLYFNAQNKKMKKGNETHSGPLPPAWKIL